MKNSIENQLFIIYGKCERADSMSFTYYDVVTIVPIGPILIGTHFDGIHIDYGNSILRFYNGDMLESIYIFKIGLTVFPERLALDGK